jgi:conjugal transfer mating pair stabilization protein TraG
MWDIWSVGDYRFLAEVLNSVAAWAGTGSPERVASIGLLISFCVLGLQGLMRGGRMPQYQNIILGWMFYGFLFGPGVTVVVKDTYSLNSQVVDNVPVGLAATGSLLSNLTHAITDDMKQALSLPTMVDDIFGGALEILSDSRNLAFPSTPDGDLNGSVINYMTDCTNVGIIRNEKPTAAVLATMSNPLEAIRWDSQIYTTRINLPGATDSTVTCSDAYSQISSYLSSYEFWSDWDAYLQNRYDTTTATSDIQNTLDSLITSGSNAKDFMLASTFYELFKVSLRQGAVALNDPVLAASISEALASRDVQAAADAQLFKRVARPGMAFFEATTYTVAPFMAFLVVLVPMGLSLVTKYFMLNIWVQLWMPSLAILNFMGNFVMQGKIEAIATKGPITSMLGAQDIFFASQNWMSTVNNLAAMVPLFTMFLVSGSMMVGSAFASRMSGSDHFDEKKMSPDVMKQDPILTNSLGSYRADLAGTTQGGARSARYSIGQTMSSVVESSSAEMKQASNDMFSGMSQSLGTNAAFQSNLSNQDAFRASVQDTSLHSSQFIRQKAAQISHSMGGGSQLTDELATSLAMDIGGRLAAGGQGKSGNKFVGADAHIGGTATQNVLTKWAEQTGTKVDTIDTNMFQMSDSEQRQFSEAVAQDTVNSNTTAFMGGTTFQEGEQVGTKASQTLSASEAYRTATSMQNSLSYMTEANTLEAGAYATREGMSGQLMDVARKNNVLEEATSLAQRYQDENGGGGKINETNMNRGIFHALYNKSMRDDDARMDLMQMTGKAYGVDVNGPTGKPTSNAGVSGETSKTKISQTVNPESKNALMMQKQNLTQPPAQGTVNDNVTDAMNGKMGAGYNALAGAQRTLLNNAVTEQSPARTAQEVMAKAYNATAGIQLGYDLLAASAGGAIGGGLKTAMESYKKEANAFLERMEKNPDAGLLDRFIDGASAIFRAKAATMEGTLDGAAIQATRIQNERLDEYRQEGVENGLSGPAADYYAAQRFNEVAGGAAMSVLGKYGEMLTPEAVDTSRYNGLDTDVRSGIDAGVERRNDAIIHMSGQLQDTLAKLDSTNQHVPLSQTSSGVVTDSSQQGVIQPPNIDALSASSSTESSDTISFIPQNPPSRVVYRSNPEEEDAASTAKIQKLKSHKNNGTLN